MSEKYKEEVLKLYNQKKREGSISTNLLEATPAKIRDECLLVYQERYRPEDDEILRLFFSSTDKGYARSIENFKTDKFRQIEKLLTLKDKPASGIKYYDVIAWLIDFNPRPCSRFITISRKEETTDPIKEKNISTENREHVEEKPALIVEEQDVKKQHKVKIDEDIESDEEVKPGKTDELPPSEEPPKTKKPIFKEKAAVAASIAMIVALTSGLAYLLFNNKKDTTPFLNFTGQEKYMYWLGDHYQPTNRSQIKDTIVIPFDAKKVSDFKKITDPDTLTPRSIGKVWYVKINNKPEFYTGLGFHPGDTLKILKPLTKHIVDNHPAKNKRLLLFLNTLFFVSLLVFLCGIFILYKKRNEKKPTNKCNLK